MSNLVTKKCNNTEQLQLLMLSLIRRHFHRSGLLSVALMCPPHLVGTSESREHNVHVA